MTKFHIWLIIIFNLYFQIIHCLFYEDNFLNWFDDFIFAYQIWKHLFYRAPLTSSMDQSTRSCPCLMAAPIGSLGLVRRPLVAACIAANPSHSRQPYPDASSFAVGSLAAYYSFAGTVAAVLRSRPFVGIACRPY